MTDEHLEREDKYDVSADFSLPDLTDAAPDAVLESTVFQLEATYYDTPSSHLRCHGISLRKRTGGRDAGWHLKLPAGDDRVELHSDSRSSAVPREFSSLLLGIRRGLKLAPAAKVSTTRHSHRLTDPSGTLLVEIADDHVNSVTMGETATLTKWREIEVELGPVGGDDELRSAVADTLLASGARRSQARSKVATALGPLPVVEPLKRLAGVIDDYVQAQFTAISEGDLGLRREQNAIHPTRVAIRRLRSTLRVFGDLFEPGPVKLLESELVWYAGLLGQVRDLDVQIERLSKQVASLPGELVLGPVAADIDSTLAAERGKAWQRLRSAMNGRRYVALLSVLEQWRVDPPYTGAGAKKRTAVAKYVDRAERKLYRRLDASVEPGADDELLHSARKAGKRFRYAAELATPVMGDEAVSKVKRAKQLQEMLGEHQDSVVSVEILRRLGARAGSSPGSNGFTYGVLLAKEQQRAQDVWAAVREVQR
ncbi:MAG: CYTH and CHAD domain-containing protein [Nocardioidaceae bacterium]